MLYKLKYYHSPHPVEILHFLQCSLLSQCVRLLLLSSQLIFYANGFQSTTNRRLLQFSTEKANVVILINTKLHGSSFPDNAAPHLNTLNSEPTFSDHTAEAAGRRQLRECARQGMFKKKKRRKPEFQAFLRKQQLPICELVLPKAAW